MRCICGCGRRGVQKHHVIYEQELRRLWKESGEDYQRRVRRDIDRHPLADTFESLEKLLRDARNLVLVAHDCHDAHHGASRRLSLHVLPDSVFEFADEVLGPERAYEYLRRRYDGRDLRHERLLLETAA